MKKTIILTGIVLVILSAFFDQPIQAEMPPSPPDDDNTIDLNGDNSDNNDGVSSTLIMALGDHRVYEIKNGKRHWIPNPDVFNHYRFNWQSIQVVSQQTMDAYARAKLLRTEGDEKVYYLTESGMIRHIPSPQVFESYGNKWEDIFLVSGYEIGAYERNTLIRAAGDYKVYFLENGRKRWIKTAEAFNRYRYDWSKIAPVNQTEINAYPEGPIIE